MNNIMNPGRLLRNIMCSSILLAVVAPAMAEDLALRLYKESGLDVQLQSMSAAFDQGFKQFSSDIPEETLKDMIQMGKESFHEPTIRKIVVAHLNEKLNKKQLQKALDWHTSDTAKKITRLENAVSTPEGQQKLAQYAQQLANKQPDKEYIEQIQKLAVASKSIDFAVEIASNMQFSMGAGTAMATAKGQDVDLEAIAAQIEQAKPMLQQQLSQYILISMLYTYQDLSKPELDSYIAFASSPDGSSFYTAMFAGLDVAFIKVGKQYGKSLGEYFEQKSKQVKS